MTEDELIGWHHGLKEDAFEEALGVGDGQRSPECYSLLLLLLLQAMGSQRVGHD